jgi:hypothetical protein
MKFVRTELVSRRQTLQRKKARSSLVEAEAITVNHQQNGIIPGTGVPERDRAV